MKKGVVKNHRIPIGKKTNGLIIIRNIQLVIKRQNDGILMVEGCKNV